MADSNMTKLAFSGALKELLTEAPFEKISVSDICERCGRNRKSFYYHFRDKFDLANWIFDTEILDLIRKNELDIGGNDASLDERWKNMGIICDYFYENRCFYRRLLTVEGQNSFVSHFRDCIHPLMHMRIVAIFGQDDFPQMVYDFVVDGIVCAIERWLLDKKCVSGEEFLYNLMKLTQLLFVSMKQQAQDDPVLWELLETLGENGPDTAPPRAGN